MLGIPCGAVLVETFFLCRSPVLFAAPVWFNGVVRSEETVILCNLGKTSAPLDILVETFFLCRSPVLFAFPCGGKQRDVIFRFTASGNTALWPPAPAMCIRIKGDYVYQGHIDLVTGHDTLVCCDIYHSADDAASVFPVLSNLQ